MELGIEFFEKNDVIFNLTPTEAGKFAYKVHLKLKHWKGLLNIFLYVVPRAETTYRFFNRRINFY